MYWIGYRFRAFVALAILAIVGSAPLIAWLAGHMISGGGEDSAGHVSSAAIAACVIIAAIIEAILVLLLIRRESRHSPNQI